MWTPSIRDLRMAGLAAIEGAACTRTCAPPRPGRTEGATAIDATGAPRVLDYAAFMKASPADTVDKGGGLSP